MLSATGGWQRRRQRRLLSDASLASKPCPRMRRHGRCRLFAVEQQLRDVLVKQKDEERRNKIKMLKEKLGLAPTDDSVDDEELLRHEPPDEWNLDVLVAERMLKRCPFAHHGIAVVNKQVKKSVYNAATGEHVLSLVQRVTCASPVEQLLYSLFVARTMTVRRGSVLTREEREVEDGAQGLSEAELNEQITLTLWDGGDAFDVSRLPRLLVLIASTNQSSGSHASSCDTWHCGPGGPNGSTTRAVAAAAKRAGIRTEQQIDFGSPVFCEFLCRAVESCLKVAAEGTKQLRKELHGSEGGAQLSSDDDEDEDEEGGDEGRGEVGHIEEGAADGEQANVGDRVLWVRQLRAQRCNIVNGTPLVMALKKRGLSQRLRALDLRSNKLDSLNFIFALKSYFPRLLSLSLIDNPITRKPNYREQMRCSLPHVALVDGEPIRRPPLALPYPSQATVSKVDDALYTKVTAFLTRYFDIWESKEFRGLDLADDWADFASAFMHPSISLSLSVHPDCMWFDDRQGLLSTQDVTADERRRITGAKETPTDVDDISSGHAFIASHKAQSARRRVFQHTVSAVLSPVELKQLRIMHVAMHNVSRNLLAGRVAVHRVVRGPQQVMSTLLATMYPLEHVSVSHHFSSGIVTIDVLRDPSATGAESPVVPGRVKPHDRDSLDNVERGPAMPIQLMAPYQRRTRRGQAHRPLEPAQPPVHHTAAIFGAVSTKPDFLLVTVHSVISWRTPSMTGSQAIMLAMDRTLTLLPYEKPPDPTRGKYTAKKHRKRRQADSPSDDSSGSEMESDGEHPPFQIHNEHIVLRPLPNNAARHAVLFDPRTPQRAAFLGSFFGMEGNDPLVRATLERANSDAAVFAALGESAARITASGSALPNSHQDASEPGLSRCETSFKISSEFVDSLGSDGGSGGAAEAEIDGSELAQMLSRHNGETTLQLRGCEGASQRLLSASQPAVTSRRQGSTPSAASSSRKRDVGSSAGTPSKLQKKKKRSEGKP